MTPPKKTKAQTEIPAHIMCGSTECEWAGTWAETKEKTLPGDPIPTEVCPKCGCETFLAV